LLTKSSEVKRDTPRMGLLQRMKKTQYEGKMMVALTNVIYLY